MARIDDALCDSDLALTMVFQQAISVNTMGAPAVAMFQKLCTDKILSPEQASSIIDMADKYLDDPGHGKLDEKIIAESRRQFAQYRKALGLPARN